MPSHRHQCHRNQHGEPADRHPQHAFIMDRSYDSASLPRRGFRPRRFTFVYVSPVQTIPAWDQTGTPNGFVGLIHLHSSVI